MTSPGIDVEVVEAELSRSDHQQAVIDLIDSYARDPLGNGRPLSDEARANLIPGLQRHPGTTVYLALAGSRAVGIGVCFEGFSTFAARPLWNIHDLAVLPDFRGRGIGRRMLESIEECARAAGCCKLTLEVLENNRSALHLYESFGFSQAQLQTPAGKALFFTKSL